MSASVTQWFKFPLSGPDAYNWYGSYPTHIADTQSFEPNFRHFDWFLDQDIPNHDMMERIWKVPEGERNSEVMNIFGGNLRCVPVLITTLYSSMFCSYAHCKFAGRPPSMWRWNVVPFFIMAFTWHNMKGYVHREKSFARDFQRNQVYAMEELKRLRDEQRVREVLYRKEFVDDHLSEWRVKQYQVSQRW